MNTVLQYALILAVLVALAIPLGRYIKKVMFGERTLLSRVLTPCEKALYRVLHIDENEQMSWKKYAVSVLVFSAVGAGVSFPFAAVRGKHQLGPFL